MKSKLDHARYIQCRLSAWFMAGLSGFWAIPSFFALRWLGPISRWEAFGPMEWLYTMLLLIHVILIAATLWIWRHPKPELLVLGLPRESARGFGVGLCRSVKGIMFARYAMAFILTGVTLAGAELRFYPNDSAPAMVDSDAPKEGRHQDIRGVVQLGDDLAVYSTASTNSKTGTVSLTDTFTRGGMTNLIRSTRLEEGNAAGRILDQVE